MKFGIFVPAVGLGLCLALSSTSCSKKSSKSSSTEDISSIKLTGTLALQGTSTTLALTDTALTDLSVYCVTLEVPPVAGTGAIAADGKFSVTLLTPGAAVGCFILNPDKAVLGTMVFKDSSQKDLNGASKSADRFALEGGASDLGAITLNLSTGKAEVDVQKIVGKPKNVTAILGEAYDFTGTYVFAESGQTAPQGYSNLCTEAEAAAEEGSPDDGSKKCDGPSLNMPIYMKRIKGVVPNSTTPAYAMAFWASKALDAVCGNKLGVSIADGIAHGIDFTNSGVGAGDFTWAPNFADGWKDTLNARVRNSILKQENVDSFKGFPGVKQYFKQYRTFNCGPNQPCQESAPIAANGFQFNANTNDSGCKNAAGKSIKFNDWSNMTCEGSDLKDAAGVSTGLHRNSCSKTVEGSLITCVNINGTFTNDGTPIPHANTRYPEDYVVLAQGAYCDKNNNSVADADEFPNFDENGPSCSSGVLRDGALCSSIATGTPEGELAQLRCYADSKDSGHDDDKFSVCKREVRTNWNAKTPAEFVSGGKAQPKGQFVFDRLDYDSATSASVRGEEHDFRGIQVGDNFTDCEVVSVFSFSMKKIGDTTDLYGEMVQTETNVSPKPVCIANFPSRPPTKYLFKMKKQAE